VSTIPRTVWVISVFYNLNHLRSLQSYQEFRISPEKKSGESGSGVLVTFYEGDIVPYCLYSLITSSFFRMEKAGSKFFSPELIRHKVANHVAARESAPYNVQSYPLKFSPLPGGG
jgi:hypothetical protein